MAGWLAGKFTKGSGFGLFKNIIVEIVGAFVGGFLFSVIALQATMFIGDDCNVHGGCNCVFDDPGTSQETGCLRRRVFNAASEHAEIPGAFAEG